MTCFGDYSIAYRGSKSCPDPLETKIKKLKNTTEVAIAGHYYNSSYAGGRVHLFLLPG